MGCADAGDGGDARGAAGSFRRRAVAEESGRISSEGFRRSRRNHGACRGHETHVREQERADRFGELTKCVMAGLVPAILLENGLSFPKRHARLNPRMTFL